MRSPASDALTMGLNIIAAYGLGLDHAALARAIELVSRRSFRLECRRIARTAGPESQGLVRG